MYFYYDYKQRLRQNVIYEAVWKENPEHCGSAVTNVISQIRRKIGDEDLKQATALNLLEQIPNFPLEEAERIAKER